MSDQVYLGVDIGTSGSKGVLVDAKGTILARENLAHETSHPRPGWSEHDAETVWWTDFTTLVRRLVDAADGRRPAGLGVSGIGPVLLPADGDGRPLRPAILYGVDTRAATEIDELTAELGAEQILARAGTALSSQAVGPKWRWTRIVTDVSGVAQQIPRQTVGAALGDAFLAAVATGAEPDPRAWNPVEHTIEPDPAAAEVYGAYHRHYRDLYTSTSEIAHFLARQQRTTHRSRDAPFTPRRLPRPGPATTLVRAHLRRRDRAGGTSRHGGGRCTTTTWW